MNTEKRLKTLHRILFEDSNHRLYAVLDGAAIPDLRSLLAQHEAPQVCLFHGDLGPELARAAPYLAELPPQAPFTRLLLTQGIGNHWGILAQATAAFRTLHVHFYQLLTVWDTTGEPLHFRYYDPRALRGHLPGWNAAGLRALFGPVTAYFAETDTGDALARFTLAGDTLGQQQLTLGEA